MTALAETLTDIDGLQEAPFMLPNATAPSAELIPGMIDYDAAMQRGLDELNAVVRVTVGTALTVGAQRRLREFRDPNGPDSVKAAIEQDRTLGGLVDDCHVTRCSPVRQFRRPEGDAVIGCDFEVRILGSPA